MKPLIVSTWDISGGAAIAAFRLHTGLRRIGCESSMFVRQKSSNIDSIIEFKPSTDFPTRLKRRLKRELNLAMLKKYPAGLLSKHEFFSLPSCEHGHDAIRQIPTTDIINLHFITGFIDLDLFFKTVRGKTPLIWTLHDMNTVTGGCHYDHGCGKFSLNCGACPILESNDRHDLSYKVWRQKEQIYSSLKENELTIVTPSKWLAEQVKKRASLTDKKIVVIPYGVDTDVFRPMDKKSVRRILGIPENSFVLLFAAQKLSSRRKGFGFLIDAVAGIDKTFPLFLLSVGGGAQPPAHLPFPSLHLGTVGNEPMMAMAYNAADVFVMPSLQDNFPNTVMESLACGTPTAAFDAGGVPEMVRENITGKLAPPEDTKALRRAIVELMEDERKRTTMSENCRRIAVEEYSLELQARRYLELYKEIAKAS